MKRNREVYCGCDANVSKAVTQMFFGMRKKKTFQKNIALQPKKRENEQHETKTMFGLCKKSTGSCLYTTFNIFQSANKWPLVNVFKCYSKTSSTVYFRQS